MPTKSKAPAHTLGPWIVSPSKNPDVYRGQTHRAVLSHPELSTAVVIADIETIPEAEANARLIAAAPALLTFTHSAATAFEERLSCLREELREDFVDADDVNDQIGNYEWLAARAKAVIAQAESHR